MLHGAAFVLCPCCYGQLSTLHRVVSTERSTQFAVGGSVGSGAKPTAESAAEPTAELTAEPTAEPGQNYILLDGATSTGSTELKRSEGAISFTSLLPRSAAFRALEKGPFDTVVTSADCSATANEDFLKTRNFQVLIPPPPNRPHQHAQLSHECCIQVCSSIVLFTRADREEVHEPRGRGPAVLCRRARVHHYPRLAHASRELAEEQPHRWAASHGAKPSSRRGALSRARKGPQDFNLRRLPRPRSLAHRVRRVRSGRG